MKTVFRLNFHTVPGQSLWLKLSMVTGGDRGRITQWLPMNWRNHGQWQLEMEIDPPSGPLEFEYSYQLRQEINGARIDEWNGPRRQPIGDPTTRGALLLLDTWCSAGTVDYSMDSAAFRAMLPARGPFAPAPPAAPNHRFRLNMAAVPPGLVPCLIGGVRELGDWDWHRAVPLAETAPNVWQTALDLPDDWRIEYKYGLFDPRDGVARSLETGENRVLAPRRLAPGQLTVVRDEGYRREPASLPRAAGVAIPVFSLRSDASLGVGEFADLKPFADWAASVGLRMIQILPVNDTTSTHAWTDSYPYSAISVFALHPLYLRIDDLTAYPMPAAFAAEVENARQRLNGETEIDYEEVIATKTELSREIFDHHFEAITHDDGFRKFFVENRDWLVPYAAFCMKRDEFHDADFREWGDWANYDPDRAAALVDPSSPDWSETAFHVWLQYELDRQLRDAVAHLHRCGIALKGDLPIGIDRESADAWSQPHLFKMDAQSGAPPDAFAVKGQNWGFPTYDWDAMAADDFAWWRSRFAHLSRYFDAFRIDHILGFFRIWQVPADQIEGIMGCFDPAQPVHIDEIRHRGIPFDHDRFCRPYLRSHFLDERFGETADEARAHYLDDLGGGVYQLKPEFATQAAVESHFAGRRPAGRPAERARADRLKAGLFDCVSDVLFFEVPGSGGTWFHPRCNLHSTYSYQELDSESRRRVDDLYVDYFYRRQEAFWQARGYEKLPAMRRASPMLLCGEDLGMVPDCVPGVMSELGILSLEIQRMPKSSKLLFADPARAPYLSVVSTSTHDMPTLRGWWREDPQVTATFAWHMLGEAFPAPELNGEMAGRILRQHLESPAMWAVFPLQDLLAIDETLRHPDPDAERINVPAIMPYYWRYRIHLDLRDLAAATGFNNRLAGLIQDTGRG